MSSSPRSAGAAAPASPPAASPALTTVGHGTLEQEGLAELLTRAAVGLVVDVRRHPGSRRHPHVNRGELERWLPEHGMAYRWVEALGGRRSGVPDSPHVAIRNGSFRAYADHMDGDEWRAALEELLDEATGTVVAIMCSESLWWRCHRRFIADAAALLHRFDVRHLMHDGRLAAHAVTDGARGVGDRIVYDAGDAQPSLFDPSG
jgi:uncharacterized protein (DUF488 family)